MNLYSNHRMTDARNDRKMNFALKNLKRTSIMNTEELNMLNGECGQGWRGQVKVLTRVGLV